MSDLKRTPLLEAHVQAGAKLVPFGGWEMPVQYAGVIGEVKAVRESCGVFDVSHMAQWDLEGIPDALENLNRLVSADWSEVPVGKVAYGLLLTEEGGILDDLMGYHLAPGHWRLVTNAGRAPIVSAHLRANWPAAADRFADIYPAPLAMLAIQGPLTAEVLEKVQPGGNFAQVEWRSVVPATLAGVSGWLSRTGYTGADGFEFMFPGSGAVPVWDALLASGAVPAGLGSRDVLRLEAGLPLYGHELREEWTPSESGTGFALKKDKPNFIGKEGALRAPQFKSIALKMEGRGIPREGYPVLRDGSPIGEITSGTMSPTVGAGIALASVQLEGAPAIGDTISVEIRGSAHPAVVVKRPFVPHRRPGDS